MIQIKRIHTFQISYEFRMKLLQQGFIVLYILPFKVKNCFKEFQMHQPPMRKNSPNDTQQNTLSLTISFNIT